MEKRKEKTSLIEKLVHINRVAKVVKGGRRFSFSALVVVGDGNGKVGFGHAKAKEVAGAVKKATFQASRNLIKVPLKEGRTLHHDIVGKYGAGHVILRSAPVGTGVIAGGPMRVVLEALGISDVVCKSLRSTNPFNMVRATFEALSASMSPRMVAIRRGLKMNEIIARRNMGLASREKIDSDVETIVVSDQMDVTNDVSKGENIISD